jgi:ribulose-5-phosphate 4-epimerase/fuculose-1-phosphate aldolase
MFLENHGTLTCGKTIYEAMYYTNHLEKACRVQIAALSAGKENLIFPNSEICKKSNSDLLSFEEDLGMRDWLALKRIIK